METIIAVIAGASFFWLFIIYVLLGHFQRCIRSVLDYNEQLQGSLNEARKINRKWHEFNAQKAVLDSRRNTGSLGQN